MNWRLSSLYLSVAGTEICWLYAALALLNQQAVDGKLIPAVILASYPLAFALGRMLRFLKWHRYFLKAVSLIVWAMMMLVAIKLQLFSGSSWFDPAWLQALPEALSQVLYGIRPELLIALSTGVAWWLGQRLAHIRVSFATSVADFQFGLVILLLTFFVSSLLGARLAESVTITIAFFFFALLGVSIAHALESRSWLSGLYKGHWLSLLLMSIGLALTLGLLISSLLTPDLLRAVFAVIKWALGQVWELIVKVMLWLSSLFPSSEPTSPPALPPMPSAEPREGFSFEIPEPLRNGLRLIWAIGFFGIILMALWRISSSIISWWRHRLSGGQGAEYESLSGAFKIDILNFLKRILSIVRALGTLLGFKVKPQKAVPEVKSVREIYHQLLRWASRIGYPRLVSQTPYEYQYVLSGVIPECQNDLDLITECYVRTRYGASRLNMAELDELRKCWHRVKDNRLKRSR